VIFVTLFVVMGKSYWPSTAISTSEPIQAEHQMRVDTQLLQKIQTNDFTNELRCYPPQSQCRERHSNPLLRTTTQIPREQLTMP
jgi:hypothetical protein